MADVDVVGAQPAQAVLQGERDAGRTAADIDPRSATRVVVTGGERALFEQAVSADPGTGGAFAREPASTWWHGVYRRPRA